jgi:hypothetical protein
VSNDHKVKVMLVFADNGAFHREHLEVSAASLEGYDRLIDCLREDPDLQKRLHVDPNRLCAAMVMDR